MNIQSQQLKKKSTQSSAVVIRKKVKEKQATASTSSLFEDEEKKKRHIIKTGSNSNHITRKPSDGIKKKHETKAPALRTKNSTLNLVEPRHIANKQISIPKNKRMDTNKKSLLNLSPASSNKSSAMNNVHNVTICSPPSKRREFPTDSIFEKKELELHTNIETMNEKQNIISRKNSMHLNEAIRPTMVETPFKEPIAFEVVFDQNRKILNRKNTPLSNDDDYSDDFESYESDFETESSSESKSSSSQFLSKSTSSDDRESPPINIEVNVEHKSEIDSKSNFSLTVIHHERKLDSGNYDLNSKKGLILESFNSFDTLINSDQLDSGISYENNTSDLAFDEGLVTYGGFSKFFSQPKINKRGIEIMSKIAFDNITCTLLELKPISYSSYMRMFGNLYTMQSMSQTQENRIHSDCQTDEFEMRSVWIQHPPYNTYKLNRCTSSIFAYTGETTNYVKDLTNIKEDAFDNTFKALSKFRKNDNFLGMNKNNKDINFESLNSFINSKLPIVSRILLKNMKDVSLDTSILSNQSKGFYNLNIDFLNALKVIRIFANVKFSLLLTVHESIENIYQKDFSNLIMVWNCEDFKKPMRLLSTWSEVNKAEICNDFCEIIVCALRDGSIAMWDLRESYSFSSKLDGYLTHFTATHSIAPSWEENHLRSFDVGSMVDVRSFRSKTKTLISNEKYLPIQFVSLNETGILTIWTLVEVTTNNFEFSKNTNFRFDCSSPWVRVKLIQSAICHMREFVDLKFMNLRSSFKRTKLNFQKNFFNENIPKELIESQSDVFLGARGLRFINLDCGNELIFVGTNRNFIISCSKTLKKERFRKIIIVESNVLFPTAIRLLENEKFLIVGLSNGSVMVLNCNKDNSYEEHQRKNIFTSYSTTIVSKFKSEVLEHEVGKSCAIQNMIKKERRYKLNNLEKDEFQSSKDAITIESENPYEIRLFDEEVLLIGSVLRKDMVQSLEYSSDNRILYVLSNGNIRVYDFFTETEHSFFKTKAMEFKIKDIATIRGQKNEMYIILLDKNNTVQAHLLKE